jgi:hypothetical protein
MLQARERNSHVVEIAKSPGGARRGVMTRRTNHGKAGLGKSYLSRFDCTACRQSGNIINALARDGIDMIRSVNPTNVFCGCRKRRQKSYFAAQGVLYRLDSSGSGSGISCINLFVIFMIDNLHLILHTELKKRRFIAISKF